MKFREWLNEDKEINEVRGSSLTDKEIKEFSGFLSSNVKWIKDELKNGHVGDIASMTESFSIGLDKWVKRLKQSDMR